MVELPYAHVYLLFSFPSPSLLPFRRATPLGGWTRMKSWRSSARVRMRQSTGASASE